MEGEDGNRGVSMTSSGEAESNGTRNGAPPGMRHLGGRRMSGHLRISDHLPVSRLMVEARRAGISNLGALVDADFDLHSVD